MVLNRNYVSHYYIRDRDLHDLHGLWGPRAYRLKWKHLLIRTSNCFYIRSYLENIQTIIIGLKQKLCKPLYSPSRPPWPPWPLRSEGKPPRVKTCIDKKTRLKQLFLQFHYFLKARVSPSKHHVYVSTGSIRAYKFKFWWFLWLKKRGTKTW